MPLKQPQQPEQPENQETALKALEMAGFNIGDYVKIPRSNAEGTWKITVAIEITLRGRNFPATLLQNESTGDLITMNLYDLCIYNPVTKIPFPEYDNATQIPEIGTNLTEGKIVFLTKVEEGKEIETIFGQITNSPIQTGKVIASTLQPNTHLINRITITGNIYTIHTEDDQTYIFDPTDTPDAFNTD